jgi:hypothetical protein
MNAFLLLAQAYDNAPPVGAGKIVGGWAYVWASYGITYAAVISYAITLWLRRKSQDTQKEPS